MTIVSIQLPETVFSALRKNPDEFVREMRIAAAVKWYESGEISQEKASEILVPTAVWHEITVPGQSDAPATELPAVGWAQRVEIANIELVVAA